MHFVEWIGLEDREEVHEKIQRHDSYLLWDRTRVRKDEMEEQLNKEAREGWRIAASAARIAEETAGDEDRKRTSGGVLLAIDSNLGAVVGAEEEAIESIPGNEGGIAQA